MKARLRRKHNGAVAWGSSGSLREGKGSTYEGGLRVPCIVRWPGRVPAGRQSDAIFATIEDRVLTTPATGTRNSQPGVAGLREKPEATALRSSIPRNVDLADILAVTHPPARRCLPANLPADHILTSQSPLVKRLCAKSWRFSVCGRRKLQLARKGHPTEEPDATTPQLIKATATATFVSTPIAPGRAMNVAKSIVPTNPSRTPKPRWPTTALIPATKKLIGVTYRKNIIERK